MIWPPAAGSTIDRWIGMLAQVSQGRVVPVAAPSRRASSQSVVITKPFILARCQVVGPTSQKISRRHRTHSLRYVHHSARDFETVGRAWKPCRNRSSIDFPSAPSTPLARVLTRRRARARPQWPHRSGLRRATRPPSVPLSVRVLRALFAVAFMRREESTGGGGGKRNSHNYSARHVR